MTREEAVVVLKALMKNPLFSEVHKVAFNIAIHDIKQRHDWDINNLILVNKDYYELLEQESILDKIRAEIEQRPYGIANDSVIQGIKYERAAILEIIDKYKAETEQENGNDD